MELIQIHKLFDIKYGNSLELINLEQCEKSHPNSTNFVSRTEKNNGISAFVLKVETIEPNPANTITVAVSGSVLATFLQPEPYYTGFHVLVLSPQKEMRIDELLFYTMCIRKNKYKYNYGRQANKTLKDILIPQFIPKAFDNIEYEKLNTLNPQSIINQDFELDTNAREWSYFKIRDVFDVVSIAKSVDLLNIELDTNGINYVGRTRENNGITARVKPSYELMGSINKGNCITIAMVGICSTFFQDSDFFASQNILILRSKDLNQYNALFIANIIRLEKYRFSYGRTLTKEFFKNHMIKLPSSEGTPDFEFMERFIKSLPYSSSI